MVWRLKRKIIFIKKKINFSFTISGWSGLLDPICEVSNEVKEEVTLRNTDNFVRNFDKQTKPFARSQI